MKKLHLVDFGKANRKISELTESLQVKKCLYPKSRNVILSNQSIIDNVVGKRQQSKTFSVYFCNFL